MTRPELIEVLSFAYNLMRASERLLEDAIEELPGGALRDFYKHHLEDERGHAQWLEEDLGFRPAYDHFAAAIAGAQYYLIKHEHPAALLGYMRVLENQGVDDDFVEMMEAEHGPEILRTWKYHVQVDRGHLQEIDDMIAKQDCRALIEANEANTRVYLEARYG